MFDVGADVGVYRLLAAVYGSGPVRAFEPFPGTADVARRVAAEHGLDMIVEEIALGQSTGSARLYLSTVTDSPNSLNARFRHHTQELTVPVERLDDDTAPPRPPTDRFAGDPTYEHLMYLLSPEPVDDALWRASVRWRTVLDRSRVRRVTPAA